MFPIDAVMRASCLLELCRTRNMRIATAESCSGGLIAACLTEVPGSSDVFQAGFVSYANAAKEAMLGLSPSLIRVFGAVSAEVVLAMARGALARSSSDLAIAASGLAGPGGGTAEKPVGLVHLAVAAAGGAAIQEAPVFSGSRTEIRLQAVVKALEMALHLVKTMPLPKGKHP